MREIKFRAWNILTKKMQSWGDIFDLPAWEIFPGTPEQRPFELMQYTGLKDKNGVEIYEGDIVHGTQHITTSPNVPFEILGEVKYLEVSTLFHIERTESKRIFPTPLGQEIYTLEVIGNIYENPELLKTKKSS